MANSRTFVASILAALLLVNLANAQPNVEFFVDFSTAGLPGRLFIPEEAENSPRPIILFLHGAGETGTNNTSQINGNINNLLAEAMDRGAFLYAPQATTYGWDRQERTDLVMSMLDQVFASQNAEPSRTYVTGLSMGGGGTWNMASRYTDRFAAAVPIAGVRAGFDFAPANLIDLPTWAFHARNDTVVTAGHSRARINEILAAAGEPTLTFPPFSDPNLFEFASETLDLSYTEFPIGGHAIWPSVYAHGEMYDWMFARAVPEPGPRMLMLLATGWLATAIRCRRKSYFASVSF